MFFFTKTNLLHKIPVYTVITKLCFLAPNRGLGARRGLLKRVDFLDPKSEQKKFRQGLAL